MHTTTIMHHNGHIIVIGTLIHLFWPILHQLTFHIAQWSIQVTQWLEPLCRPNLTLWRQHGLIEYTHQSLDNILCQRGGTDLVKYTASWSDCWGGWGCEVSCGGHHRPRGKTTTGSALDGAVFDIAQILAYLVHNMSRSQLYLGFGHFVWLPSFFRSITFWRAYG